MIDNKTHWNHNEKMMANSYANIALSISQLNSYMQNHLETVKLGGGIITDGDIEEIIQYLLNIINKSNHFLNNNIINQESVL